MLVGASVIAGCISNPPSVGSGPNQKGTQEITAPATPTAPTVTLNRPAPGSVKAVDYNLLIPLLPNAPAGWTAGDPGGMNILDQDVLWAIATRSYSSGANKEAEVSISDSAYYNVGAWTDWASLSETNIATSADGYLKSGTVAGFPSWESYDNSSNSYNTLVGLNNRFMVAVSIQNGDKTDLDSFVNSMNYPGIATLK